MHVRLVWLGLVLASAACGGSQGRSEPVSSPSDSPAPASPSLVSLDDATPGGPWVVPAPSGTPLVLAVDSISLADAIIVSFIDRRVPAEYKAGGETGYLITPLHETLRLRREREDVAHSMTSTSRTPRVQTLALAIDPTIPFDTISEVIYTAGQAGYEDLPLLVSISHEIQALPFSLPEFHRPSALTSMLGTSTLAQVLASGPVTGNAEEVLAVAERGGSASSADAEGDPARTDGQAIDTRPDALNLLVTITRQGLQITGAGGRLAPGCDGVQTGRAPAVPATPDGQDLVRLHRCLGLVHEAFPDERTIRVSAEADTPFAVVARVLATARGTEAAPLFPIARITTSAR